MYAIFSGALITRVFNRLVRTRRLFLYLMSDLGERFAQFFKMRIQATRLDDNDFAELVSWHDHKDCDIFITMPVRKLGNPHCYFSDYLYDLMKLTTNLNRVVTYVMIDEDDDLRYFLNLKRMGDPALRVRYFVKPKNGGYSGGHAMHSLMIEDGPLNYKVWVLGASDAQPAFFGWDENLMKAIDLIAGTCIIGGGPRWSAGAIHGPNPDGFPPIYWVGTDDFIFASKTTIDTLKSETLDLEGWLTVGDTWHVDGFFADLVRHMVQKGSANYFVATQPLLIERDARGWQGVLAREQNRNKTLTEFFHPSRQRIHSKLADALIKSNTDTTMS